LLEQDLKMIAVQSFLNLAGLQLEVFNESVAIRG